MLGPLKELKDSEGYHHHNLFSFFTARVRQNLRIVLSMDPAHPDYAARCEANPALYSRCSIQWLDTWNSESMQLLPKARISFIPPSFRLLPCLGGHGDYSAADREEPAHPRNNADAAGGSLQHERRRL